MDSLSGIIQTLLYCIRLQTLSSFYPLEGNRYVKYYWNTDDLYYRRIIN